MQDPDPSPSRCPTRKDLDPSRPDDPVDDPLGRIPDSIEPISAYRAWFYSIEGRTAELYPISGFIEVERLGRCRLDLGDRVLPEVRVADARGAFGRLRLRLLLPQGARSAVDLHRPSVS